MKNTFYFVLKTLSVLKIFKFFSPAGKRLDKKDKVNFKIFDVATWLINNYNTNTAQYLKK